MNYDGKTYRNLEGQVKYLTEVAEALDERITEVAANIPSKMIVEELPEEGDPNITYYVGPKGTEPNLYYEVWVWVQEEPDGPFVWRELEDTDQVDLSGYVEKMTGTPSYPLVYVLLPNGNQGSIEANANATANTIARRTGDGTVRTNTPTNNLDAANKQYVDNNFVAKRTDVTTNYYAYCKASDGSQTTLECTGGGGAGKLALYVGNGNLNVGAPTSDTQATNKKYVDDTFVAKVNTVTTYRQVYAKNPDGTQYMQVINGKDFDAGVDRIACFGTDGRLRVGEPVNAKDAATKGYVDATVGQLLYFHDINLIINVDGTNKLFIKAYLVNGSSTAITTFDRFVYKQLDVQWGGYGPNDYTAFPVAVTKLPDSFRQDEFNEPLPGFLYQYFSGGNLVSANTTSSMTTTITDVVTTW